jgi:chromosome segregation ATPase
MDAGNAPATKSDIADLDEKIGRLDKKFDQKIDQLDKKIDEKTNQLDQKIDQLRSEVNHGYRDLVERIGDSETRLLRAFYDFAQSNQKRMMELEGNEAAIRSRLATVEDRLLQVEKRLNMPPQAG